MNRKKKPEKNTGKKSRKESPHHQQPRIYTDTTAWYDSRGRFAAGIIAAEGAGDEPGLGIAGVIKPRSSARLAR